MLQDKIKTRGDELRIKLVKGDGKTVIRVVKENPVMPKRNTSGTFKNAQKEN